MNTESKRVVLASNNAGKLKEFSAILAQAGISMVPQGQLNIPEAEEPFATFIENALAKARHASQLSGLPALADDSGLCVRAWTTPPAYIPPVLPLANWAVKSPMQPITPCWSSVCKDKATVAPVMWLFWCMCAMPRTHGLS